MCDNPIPAIGHPCDTLTTTTGGWNTFLKVLAFFLIGFVLFMDIFIDVIVVLFDQIGNATEGIPIVGSIVGFIEGTEFDDIIDFLSMAIMFYFIGPVTLVGIPEYAEGLIEIFPFWTTAFIVWLLIIRPIRQRDLARRKAKIQEEFEAQQPPEQLAQPTTPT